jgi:hypothetical protein
VRLSVLALLVLPGEVRGTARDNKFQPADRKSESQHPPDHYRSPAIRHVSRANATRGGGPGAIGRLGGYQALDYALGKKLWSFEANRIASHLRPEARV